MKLRLDLMLPAILIATAGIEVMADALPLEHPRQTCRSPEEADPVARAVAEEQILAEGYSEISVLTKGCDNSWHALALAEGDPVNVLVTPQGAVLTE
jgi:hypothetical protein